ncbi:hypothetical protein CDAR_174431 [Caerostris darwini]|uniref:Uncharacterized protein n=1 Tax=Caerostris darwini TaxID=1538125 RepID=A0AAV4PEB0_9ARAC|nr:hypothetical protein CDAR_174431 [Caerostris darwini]
MTTTSRLQSQLHDKNQFISRMQIPRKRELMTHLFPKTHKSSTPTIAHRITSVQVPDIRKATIARMLLGFRRRKQMKIPLPSVFVIWQGDTPPNPHRRSIHALRGA